MKPITEQRPVDRYFEEYNQVYKLIAYPAIIYIAVAFILFGLLGVAWALPFPYIAFLGKYNGYLNWASFLIAGLIYFYLRLSPIISYLILFVLFAFSYGIIQLEQWQKAGGPSLLVISLIVLIAGIVCQIVIYKLAKLNGVINLIIKSTVWILVSALRAFKLKY